MTESKTHPLNDRWWLWMHGMKDDKWSKESYKRIGDSITTLEQFIGISHHLRDCLADSMFFLMRHGKGPEDEPIYPMWEDPNCINGGAFKFKVTRNDASQAWWEIAIRLIGETITNKPDEILGVSISPKKNFVTIRIWNRDSSSNDHSQLLLPERDYFSNAIYDAHKSYQEQTTGAETTSDN